MPWMSAVILYRVSSLFYKCESLWDNLTTFFVGLSLKAPTTRVHNMRYLCYITTNGFPPPSPKENLQDYNQCFGSGSPFDGRLDPDPHSECGSVSRSCKKEKMQPKDNHISLKVYLLFYFHVNLNLMKY
jgi:hypothetical protein